MTAPAPVSREQVTEALNRAADDILDALYAEDYYVPDVGLRDGLNLLVNATGTYLDDPTADLRDAVEENYDASYTEVLEWTAAACR